MASKKIIEAKAQVVANILDKIKRSKSIVMVDYRGITVEADTQMRNQLRKENIEYRVLKNRLVLRAMQEAGYTNLDKVLEGPTAIAFGYEDAVAPARILKQAVKDGKPALKAGIVEGNVLDAEGITAVASIPAKEVLVAQLLGMLTMPLRGLAVSLDQIAKQKESQA